MHCTEAFPGSGQCSHPTSVAEGIGWRRKRLTMLCLQQHAVQACLGLQWVKLPVTYVQGGSAYAGHADDDKSAHTNGAGGGVGGGNYATKVQQALT